MKTLFKTITLGLFPIMVHAFSWAADEAASDPVSPASSGNNVITKSSSGDPRADFDRAEQRYRAQLGVAPSPDARFSQRLQSIIARAGGGVGSGPGGTLVISSSEISKEARENLEEDLAVMGRVLDKALEEAPGRFQPSTAMGINLAFAPDAGARLRSFYLDDYGAVFLLRVGYPLLPPPATGEKKEKKEPGDPAWEEAKQELYGQPPGPGMPPGHVEEFSQERVNKLKEALLASLKSAANVRGLKPEDFITVSVFGAPAGDTPLYGAGAGVAWASNGQVFGSEQQTSSVGSVLTLRVKKGDVDNFAKGTVNLEGFQNHVRVEVYRTGVPSRGPSGGAPAVGGGGGGGVRF